MMKPISRYFPLLTALIAVALACRIAHLPAARPTPIAAIYDARPVTKQPTSTDACTPAIVAALKEHSCGLLEYSQGSDQGKWSLEGVSGELRAFQWDAYRNGPVFDLVAVYYQDAHPDWPLWAAVGVTLPPYYTVSDSASYERYRADGHGDAPYYLSFTQGVQSHEDAEQVFSIPGKQLVSLSVSGPNVSADGIDWAGCEPVNGEYCLLARFFESLEPPMLDVPPGQSNQFLYTGSMPSDPTVGFLLWQIKVQQNLNLCAP